MSAAEPAGSAGAAGSTGPAGSADPVSPVSPVDPVGAERSRGAAWRGARRLARHQLLLAGCLVRWLLRRGPHGRRAGDRAFGYARAESPLFWIMLTVSVVETVALALLIPWPLVHAILLALGLWGTFLAVELRLSCVVRPHLVGADGSLRLRYGALVDISVPAEQVSDVRVNRRFRSGGPLAVDPESGTADLAVAGQTTLTVELTAPLTFHRPLGRPVTARLIHCHADDPGALAKTWHASAGASGATARERVDETRRPSEEVVQ
ncbi:hypothetical protein [Streptomyces triticirhizae]|uniref:hypothetical protein n=1 Tax=Streptomyces triticirhizae TaxID=2483353 RepID=UPI0018F444B7|nr:hypothetical protein [Streptomyces triticirhizae]